MENYAVTDTETAGGLNKPFAYDVSYVIYDGETHQPIAEKAYVIEQVWHNMMLFESAYYAEKRPLYVSAMRGRNAQLVKWGQAMRAMARDFEKYGVKTVYAYNSKFDDNVIRFNCDWYHTKNPLDNIPVRDIWGYASQFITNDADYTTFCEAAQRFTDEAKNYSTSAESVYAFITNNAEYKEWHIGIEDCKIEAEILQRCFELGAESDKDYKVVSILERAKPFTIKVDGKVIYTGTFLSKRTGKNNVYNFRTVKPD